MKTAGPGAAGRLREPAVFAEQVHRMLGDERTDALVEKFHGQVANSFAIWRPRFSPDLPAVPDSTDTA